MVAVWPPANLGIPSNVLFCAEWGSVLSGIACAVKANSCRLMAQLSRERRAVSPHWQAALPIDEHAAGLQARVYIEGNEMHRFPLLSHEMTAQDMATLQSCFIVRQPGDRQKSANWCSLATSAMGRGVQQTTPPILLLLPSRAALAWLLSKAFAIAGKVQHPPATTFDGMVVTHRLAIPVLDDTGRLHATKTVQQMAWSSLQALQCGPLRGPWGLPNTAAAPTFQHSAGVHACP
jgi:hypothetical protein